LKAKKEIVESKRVEYQSASKKRRGEILNEVVSVTGLNRDYAAHVLATYGRVYYKNLNGQTVKVQIGLTEKKRAKGRHGGRPVKYTGPFLDVLAHIWDFYGRKSGTLLVPLLRSTMPFLVQSGKEGASDTPDFKITPEIEALLLTVSKSEVDRLLKGIKGKLALKGISLTTPGPLLRNQIPVRTYFKWDERKPGFFEVDRVAHCGNTTAGQFCWTLTVTDVYSGWTEERSTLNNAHRWTKEAIEDVKNNLLFPMKGIDSDNGGEFINTQLKAWCDAEHIQFTRSRPYRKNDNCFVEQKNGDNVRKVVGYWRYEDEDEKAALAQVYQSLNPLRNYWMPSIKITGKEKAENGRYKKIYDKPKTPYERLLESAEVNEGDKERLRAAHDASNPVALTQRLNDAVDALLALHEKKAKLKQVDEPLPVATAVEAGGGCVVKDNLG
jgi:hypothetical protein